MTHALSSSEAFRLFLQELPLEAQNDVWDTLEAHPELIPPFIEQLKRKQEIALGSDASKIRSLFAFEEKTIKDLL